MRRRSRSTSHRVGASPGARGWAAALVATAIGLCALPAAFAQPMMIDPSRMSGIPRADPQVPAGTVTVRLIRGELSNRVVGTEVELIGPAGQQHKAKTDAEGRATFAALSGGPFRARAVSEDGEELVSQPIALPDGAGVRVMLVFSPGGAGSSDGVGRPDKTVPAGTVLVQAVDGEGKPLVGVDVVIGHARSGEPQVREHKAKTDAAGQARFEGLDAKPTSGYLAEVLREGVRYAGKPFRLSENRGSRVVIAVRPTSKDVSQLRIGPGSHFIVEVIDDAIQVVEVWRLHNEGTTAIDPGPGGLRFSLPDRAVSASAGPQSPPSFTVSGHEAVWKGPIPPGDTELQAMFVLTYEGGEVELRQRTPVPFTELALIVEKLEGLSVEGEGLHSEDRELQGRRFLLVRGPGTAQGGELSLRLRGLPHGDPTWRLMAAGLSLLIVIGLGGYAFGGRSPARARAELVEKREGLLDELAALEAKGAAGKADKSDKKREQKRVELEDRLAQVYRELDEVGL